MIWVIPVTAFGKVEVGYVQVFVLFSEIIVSVAHEDCVMELVLKLTFVYEVLETDKLLAV